MQQDSSFCFEVKKIAIFGIPGSGKSTFAQKLSHHLNLSLFHLDKYFFVSGWQERDFNEFIKIQESFIQQDRWVIDGNSLRSLENRFSKADIVLYFRMNRLVCLWRVFKRWLKRDSEIYDRAPNCPEVIRFRLLRYLWLFPKRVHNLIQELKTKYPSVEFHEITNDKQAQELLENLKKRQKYLYKPYSNIFPFLFENEKTRIQSFIGKKIAIEHIGSTAISQMGGKGIIDIALGALPDQISLISKHLQKLGYEFRPSFSTEERFYFIAYLPDPEIGSRRYHVHLMYSNSPEWKQLIHFRDVLRSNSKLAQEYADIKKEAAKKACGNGKEYRALKDAMIKKINLMSLESSTN